jgi:hypothetical protein
MKTMVAVAVLMVMLVVASSAGAVDIKGKWGIGAGIIDRGGEVSLIRGRSERSAWLFDVGISQQDLATRTDITPVPPPSPSRDNDNTVSILAGPGYRRFVRPGGDLSPYWDLRLLGIFSRRHSGGAGISDTQTQAGAEGRFSFGLEYFTPWHFSVAAHSSLVVVSWTHVSDRGFSPASESRGTGHFERASIGLSPAIFLRGYF